MIENADLLAMTARHAEEDLIHFIGHDVLKVRLYAEDEKILRGKIRYWFELAQRKGLLNQIAGHQIQAEEETLPAAEEQTGPAGWWHPGGRTKKHYLVAGGYTLCGSRHYTGAGVIFPAGWDDAHRFNCAACQLAKRTRDGAIHDATAQPK